MEDAEREPEYDERKEVPARSRKQYRLRPHHADRKNQRDHEQANAFKPIQPLSHGEVLVHDPVRSVAPTARISPFVSPDEKGRSATASSLLEKRDSPLRSEPNSVRVAEFANECK